MAFKTGQAASLVWRQHVEAFKRSGLTRPAYCREHRIRGKRHPHGMNTAASHSSPYPIPQEGRRRATSHGGKVPQTFWNIPLQ
jgi:hypothetical protein